MQLFRSKGIRQLASRACIAPQRRNDVLVVAYNRKLLTAPLVAGRLLCPSVDDSLPGSPDTRGKSRDD